MENMESARTRQSAQQGPEFDLSMVHEIEGRLMWSEYKLPATGSELDSGPIWLYYLQRWRKHWQV